MNEPMKHLSDDDLILFHYGESEQRACAARHVLSCSYCREQYDELLAMLEALDTLAVPVRGPGHGEQVWLRLEPKLGARKPRPSAMSRRQRWVLAASVLLMLGAAFLGGRLWSPGGPSAMPVGPIPEQGRERILLLAVGDHLDRAQRMLLEIANEHSVEVPDVQQRATELLAANRLYRQILSDRHEPALQRFLEELERVLLDMAHDSAGADGSLETVRARIEKQGLLFKMRVVGSQVRQQQKEIPSTTSANRT